MTFLGKTDDNCWLVLLQLAKNVFAFKLCFSAILMDLPQQECVPFLRANGDTVFSGVFYNLFCHLLMHVPFIKNVILISFFFFSFSFSSITSLFISFFYRYRLGPLGLWECYNKHAITTIHVIRNVTSFLHKIFRNSDQQIYGFSSFLLFLALNYSCQEWVYQLHLTIYFGRVIFNLTVCTDYLGSKI